MLWKYYFDRQDSSVVRTVKVVVVGHGNGKESYHQNGVEERAV
jgi:hypothetical protein